MSAQPERQSREDEQKLVKKIKNYIYDPGQVIGSGFSSNVYKGINELNGQTIAIKVLELTKIQTEVQKYLLNNQINALRALSHPHVLRTVQILMTKNNVYIMTQFCQNGDLQQYVKRQGRLSQSESLYLIREVVEGYLAIEDKKIVHRDLKTANIFLTSTGARIADFGFCQFLNQTKKPQVFYNVGSPAYMSPESYRDNVYSPKSDLWSIGIILYQMLVGDTPDKNLTYSEMSNNLMTGRISNISNQEIKKILAGCFKKDLKERLSPVQLLEAVKNQIGRLEQPKNMRPQTVQPNTTNHRNKPLQMTSVFPVTPNQMNGQRHIHNRHMVSSAQPIEYHSQGLVRSQSPFKPRFVNQLGKDQHPSPLKQQFQRRFRDESPLRGPGLVKEQNNKIKTLTQVLLFLYRLLSFLGQTEFEGVNFMRLILFRHRSYLQSAVDKIMIEERHDRGSYEPFKQFQFLKSRFDEAYLQKQAQSSSHSLPIQIMSKLNQLANQPFTEMSSLVIYCGLIIDACKECDRILKSGVEGVEVNKMGGLWDYLMIHFQILELYGEGCAVEKISQTVGLTLILKDQPKKIVSAHCQLLSIKFRSIQDYFQHWNSQIFHEKRGNEDSNGKINDIPERKYLINNGFF